MLAFLTGVFYFLFLVCTFICELTTLHYTKATKERILKMTEGEDVKKLDDDTQSVLFWQFCYCILGIIGLFSSQWPIFVALLLLGLYPTKWRPLWLMKLDSILCIAGVLFMVINRYHLHLNLNPF